MTKTFILFTIILIFSGCVNESEKPIAIQPWGDVDETYLNTIEKALIEVYGYSVVRLPGQRMPDRFFINTKSPRYRADSIISLARSQKPDSIRCVLVITEKDISVTKRDESGKIKLPVNTYSDWGVFGYGYRPGSACVLSTFRLHGKDEKTTLERIRKVALHEIGHNLGLKHCTSTDCVMKDAVEKISTVDQVDPLLCKSCLKKLK